MTTDAEHMARAVAVARGVRHRTSPNPAVGAVLLQADGTVVEGATHPPGGPHAEVDALSRADAPRGATMYVTLEPCNHHGRTGPCTDAIIAAGVARVVVGRVDPDAQVAGGGMARLREAGIDVDLAEGMGADAARDLMLLHAPYFTHRATGRPWVVLKLAATLDGRTAAPDGTSQWITGEQARADVHRLRAESDVIVVGAGTVRADDPSLRVRDWPAPEDGVDPLEVTDPERVILGTVDPDARVRPCREFTGTAAALIDELSGGDVVQVMVEGGATVAQAFHESGLVDQYVVYLAPALFGGDDAVPMFRGPGAPTMDDLWRGHLVEVRRLGSDLRFDLLKPGTPEQAAQIPSEDDSAAEG